MLQGRALDFHHRNPRIDQYHHFLSTLNGLVRKKNFFKWETSKNFIHDRPFLGGKMELQPKSVIFTTILLSTTQLVDFRRPWTSVLLECRYDIPCSFSDNRKTKRYDTFQQLHYFKERNDVLKLFWHADRITIKF